MTRNKTSEMILEHKIRMQLDILYHAFDADNNGYISADEINLDNVSAKILEIFTPLFVEMENLGESLSKDDFSESAYELFKVSSNLKFITKSLKNDYFHLQTLGPIDKDAVLSFKRD